MSARTQEQIVAFFPVWPAKDVETDARNFLAFAIDKAVSHRRISAERSVTTLREFAWLLCRDDIVQAMDAADYLPFGVPKLKAFADGMGWPLKTEEAWEQVALNRMAKGLPCVGDCDAGCGQ